MSREHTSESAIAEAARKEREYDWFLAAALYAEAAELKEEDPQEAGNLLEQTGECFYRSAMQAGRKAAFRERLRKSIDAYERAYRSYEDTTAEQKAARQLRCDAVIQYLRYWLASEPSQKRKLLDQCLESEAKALARFWGSEEFQEFCRTYAKLWLVFFCRVFLEPDRNSLKTILEKGLEWGKKAVSRAQKLDEPSVVRICLALATCLSDAGFYLNAQSENTDINRLKAISHLQKALNLSEKSGDRLHSGLCHLWLGINSGGEEAEEHHKKAFEHGQLTGDSFLIANSLDYLAYDAYWKALATEDPQGRIEIAEAAMQHYAKAMHHYSIISFLSPRGGFIGPPSGQAEHFYQLARWETDAEQRGKLLAESEKAGLKALKTAEEAGMPMVIANVKHVLAKTLQYRSYTISSASSAKRKFLERALEHRETTVQIFDRLTPFFYWNLGVMRNYLSEIKTELADIESDFESKKKLLEQAAQDKEDCLRLLDRVIPYLERKGETSLYAALRNYQDSYFTVLTRLYDLTNNARHLRKAVEISKEAIQSAEKLEMVALVAESNWKIGKAQDRLGEHKQAAERFESAAQNYARAAKKMSQLTDFYTDHATYMHAWSEIEKARDKHANKQYGQAQRHYQEAADLHQRTKRWSYLTSNYSAWANLEAAEDQSRKEQTHEAKTLFQKAATLFREAQHTLTSGQTSIGSLDERDLTNRLIIASDIRHTYCLGRLALEEARILSQQGENAASAAKYGIAADKFQKALDSIQRESAFTDVTVAKDEQELTPIIRLCKAWQTMKRAEAQASPNLFQQAAHLFDEVKEQSFNEETKLLALGHSHFCRALGLGTEFEDSRDESLYISATQHIETAANYYAKAGVKTASEFAVATQRLLDAYVYMTNAQKETNPSKKTRLFIAAEKLLQTSIGSYLKAKHPAKSKQVRRLLERVREERVLAASLGQILDAPAITSSTASFLIPTPSEEIAVGLERFESANIEAKVVAPSTRAPIGANLTLRIQISNVSRQSVLLDRIDGVLSAGLELVAKPSYCNADNSHLRLNGKRLTPLKSEEVLLVIRGAQGGAYLITPKIRYVDETGRQLVSELEPTTIEVSEMTLSPRVATGYQGLDDALFGGIPEKCAVLVTSSHHDELDLLIKRFLETGIRTDQITLHFTTKPTDAGRFLQKLKSRFYLFICNPQAGAIPESSPNIQKLKGVENLTEINIALASTLRTIQSPPGEPRRCCIHIISDVLLQHKALQTRKWLAGLIPVLKSHGFTTLAVADPGMHSAEEVRAILDLFDGEVSIQEKKEGERSLRVRRMTDQEYVENEMPLGRQQ